MQKKKQRQKNAKAKEAAAVEAHRIAMAKKFGMDPAQFKMPTQGGGRRGGKKKRFQNFNKKKKNQNRNNKQQQKEKEKEKKEKQAADDSEDLVDDWEQAVDDSDDDNTPKQPKSDDSDLDDWEKQMDNSDDDDDTKSPQTVEKTSKKASDDDDNDWEKAADKASSPSGESSGAASSDGVELRSPICCVLGHVDTGKTKLLDKIRRTNVQDKEAGGITQQIGATYFPKEVLESATKKITSREKAQRKGLKVSIPGLLVIDTPGHESFTNLRSRGSNLCDIAILVVDLMHAVEQQTIESIQLLKKRKTPFVIALNKVDRLYNWKAKAGSPIRPALKRQGAGTKQQFEERVKACQAALAAEHLNTELYWKNKSVKNTVSMVPTSAHTGEGIPDLLLLLAQMTQTLMKERFTVSDELECTVLEVKKTPGHGTTIDVILINGKLHRGDTIVVCGTQGAIVTKIRALLCPPSSKELRVKSEYLQPAMVKAAQGIKIVAQDLDNAVPGSSLFVLEEDDDVDELKEMVQEELEEFLERTATADRGVFVQASTLGSLEALLDFLSDMNIPVARGGIHIGPIHKKDVMRATVMLDRKMDEYACILAFDVTVEQDARTMANGAGIKIFEADIIYHLFDMFTEYVEGVKERKKNEAAEFAVFPCILRILPNSAFRNRNPLLLGCKVVEGSLRVGTPLSIPAKGVDVGKVIGIQANHKDVTKASKDEEVAVKIESVLTYGRQFDDKSGDLVSKISRQSIDMLKQSFRDEVSKDDVQLLARLKKIFDIN